MPLDVPANATRGWDILSLKQGYQSLLTECQSMLGLFCRVSCTQLLIQDNEEFNNSALGQHRAVAASLNTMLFNQISCNPGQFLKASTKISKDYQECSHYF